MTTLTPADAKWPRCLTQESGSRDLRSLQAIGCLSHLKGHKTALLCSAKAPGAVILGAHDAARRLRDDGVTVVSGFHSPIEQECLRILMRGKQPIIMCPARTLEDSRIPKDWRVAIDAGRLLLLSPFEAKHRRVTAALAQTRNEFVAALANEVFIAYARPGSHTENLARRVVQWGKRLSTIDLPINAGLMALGAHAD